VSYVKIVGHGIDIVEVGRFAELCKNQRYVQRCFTHLEQVHSKNQPDRLAARFAAKEAVLKALHIGLANGVSLKDVEIGFSESGAPEVRLSGSLVEIAGELKISEWHLSFSHGLDYAVASVIACSSEP